MVKPAGTFEKLSVNVSAAGPRFWTEARKAVGTSAPFEGTEYTASCATLSAKPGCVGRDRDMDDALGNEVRIRRRSGDDLDRVRPALRSRRRGCLDISRTVDRDRPALRGLRGERVGIGQARVNLHGEGRGCILVGRHNPRAFGDREHRDGGAIERDRVGAIAVR